MAFDVLDVKMPADEISETGQPPFFAVAAPA
jgi:hypothetical protein